MGRSRLRDKMATLFELPGDVLLDVARISLIGDVELLVENHRGLVEFRADRVVLGTPNGRLTVSGENLVIGSISPEQVTVVGTIRSLAYLN